jgi:hypothetical protein
MNAAKVKNRAAFSALLKSEALADRLGAVRLAIVTPDRPSFPSARLLAVALADNLGRLWPNIDFLGVQADEFLATAVAAAESGGSPTDGLRSKMRDSAYTLVVAIDCVPDSSLQSAPVLQIAANDWQVEFGPSGRCGESLNPVGPAFAASLCAAQVFLRVFEKELVGRNADFLEHESFDVRELFGVPQLEVAPLDLGEVQCFGVGAVTHAFVWLVENWPTRIQGRIELVDPDPYGSSNGQRYAFMRAGDVAKSKVKAVGARLRGKHPGLDVGEYELDLNTYCAGRGYRASLERVIVGLDSPEARRQVALKLPVRAINMWTGEHRAGASRYVPDGVTACLACDYLEDLSSPRDETAQYVEETGLPPEVVRSLLDSPRALSDSEAQRVASHRGVPVASILGAPIRSVRPILCATGRLQVASGGEATDVPFSFASLSAGVSGFIMLLKDLQSPTGSEGWSQNVFVSPTRHMLDKRGRKQRCVHCDEVYAESSIVR